ncbi:hypothetical protein Vadar_018534 [Vaccinium darrowii]|nr:hypothetical protein Vadar_018534 [Vaccinium darrowii]
MVMSFFGGVSAAPPQDWTTIWGSRGDDTRVMMRKSINDPGCPSGMVICAATSFRLPVSQKRVFDFLRDDRFRTKVVLYHLPYKSPQKPFDRTLILSSPGTPLPVATLSLLDFLSYSKQHPNKWLLHYVPRNKFLLGFHVYPMVNASKIKTTLVIVLEPRVPNQWTVSKNPEHHRCK